MSWCSRVARILGLPLFPRGSLPWWQRHILPQPQPPAPARLIVHTGIPIARIVADGQIAWRLMTPRIQLHAPTDRLSTPCPPVLQGLSGELQRVVDHAPLGAEDQELDEAPCDGTLHEITGPNSVIAELP